MSDENSKKALNLDELFGDARAVKVIHEGIEYEFMRMDGLGPRQATQLQKMQRQAQKLQLLGEEMSEAQAQELEALLNEIITLLCPKFPVEGMSFLKRLRVIMFYMEETEGKKAMEAALNEVMGRRQTGARRSRS